MKRDELKKLLGDAATDEVIDKIMSMNGADIETHKTKATELQGQLDTANQQLTEASTAIEGFRKLKPKSCRPPLMTTKPSGNRRKLMRKHRWKA